VGNVADDKVFPLESIARLLYEQAAAPMQRPWNDKEHRPCKWDELDELLQEFWRDRAREGLGAS